MIDPIDVERFADRYTTSGSPAAIAAEFDALGSDYQANGYTTRRQADRLGRALRLGPGKVLVDLGAGCGWPGLYLAVQTGCDVISTDPVAEGIGVARRRAVSDAVADRSVQMQATAERIPLRAKSVDAVVHTDLLC